MASPLRIYTLPNSTFGISLVEGAFSENENPNDLNLMRRYMLQIPQDELGSLGIPDTGDLMEGLMSPIDDLTFPPVVR